MKLITISLVALALSATTALAQNRSFYGPSGQYLGSANTSGNTTTFYGPAGQYQGSANTFGNTTTYYGPRSSIPARPKKIFFREGHAGIGKPVPLIRQAQPNPPSPLTGRF